MRISGFFAGAALVAVMALSGCESSEERAERHFQSALELIAAGDVERAFVEFRNVFDLDPLHVDARREFARALREEGQTRQSYRNYLRLVEQVPDDLEGQLALAEMAFFQGDWEAMERHGRAAFALDPEDPAVAIVNDALDYRDGVLSDDEAAMEAAVTSLLGRLEETPDSFIARRVLVDDQVRRGDSAGALADLDILLESQPADRQLNILKLQILGSLGDEDAVGDQLRTMYELFPEDEEVQTSLIGYYLVRGDLDGAEGFLRQLADASGGDPAAHSTVVRFLYEARGIEAARAELDRLIELGENTVTYRGLRAGLLLDEDRTDEAIAEFEDILSDAEPSEATRRVKIALARVLEQTGNTVGARARVEEVLAEDPTNVEALKMRARWLIDGDQPGEALVALRAALDQDPDDTEVLRLMADAHLRDGSRDLAGERLSVAVEVSGSAPEESLIYAQFLAQDDRLDAAETVLSDALRNAPDNIALQTALAEIALQRGQWGRTENIIADLRRIGSEQALAAADSIQAGMMLRQEKTDESIALIESMLASGTADASALGAIVQAQLRQGRTEEAAQYLDELLAQQPDDPALRYLRAGVHVLAGETGEAETIYSALIEELPQAEEPVRSLYSVLSAEGRSDEARAVLAAALERMPQSPNLRWMRAGEYEAAGDFEAAIGVYEELYAQNSGNAIIANNLASLISTHRTDEESLDRAFVIARRLRGSDVPAFQDTYGWIAYRRGDYDEALAHLEPAARGLPDDPLVQYHLGMTQAALEMTDAARETLTRALELAGDNPLPQFQTARETLESLDSAGE